MSSPEKKGERRPTEKNGRESERSVQQISLTHRADAVAAAIHSTTERLANGWPRDQYVYLYANSLTSCMLSLTRMMHVTGKQEKAGAGKERDPI